MVRRDAAAHAFAALNLYELQHIPEHLVSAGLVANLHKLLFMETAPDANDSGMREPKSSRL